jgi:hypothetical protein
MGGRIKVRKPASEVSVQKKKVSPEEVLKDKMADTDKEALAYLQDFHHAQQQWKFAKSKQIRLFRMMYDRQRVSKTQFKLMKLYVRGVKGAVKERLIEEAQLLVKTEMENNATKEQLTKQKRAKKLLKWLQD